jgi:hypothetical protein
MAWNRFFKTLFQSNKKSCIAIFEEARKRSPGKANGDYLKFVLLSKAPFDYQEDRIIDSIISVFSTIDDLESFVSDVQKDETFWAMRNKNLKRRSNELTVRNNEFFQTF